MIKKIFFDMDGVLADFDRGVKELCHMEPVPQDEGWKPGDNDLLWARAREVPHFYDKLEPVEGSIEMFRKIYEKYGDKCEILSGIPKPKRGMLNVKEDKIAWTRRLISKDIVVNLVYREEKPNYSTGKDCILIDDLQININEWEKGGGSGILFVSPEEMLRRLEEIDDKL